MIGLFVILLSRGNHIQSIDSLFTDAFIQVLGRFSSRSGMTKSSELVMPKHFWDQCRTEQRFFRNGREENQWVHTEVWLLMDQVVKESFYC